MYLYHHDINQPEKDTHELMQWIKQLALHLFHTTELSDNLHMPGKINKNWMHYA
jgi:hypothetical protein